MRVKSVIYGVLGIIIGIVLFFAAISTLSNPGQVTCGGQTMSQGDTCEHYRNGVQTGTSDYEQEKQNNQNGGIFMVILGPLMVIGSIFLLRSGLKRQPTSYSVRTQAYRPPQPGAYPPPPSYPSQQPGAYPPQQPGAYPPAGYPPQQPGGAPPPYSPR
jgi:hypothetical protein